ncbi:protein arginine N-methyltransferase 1.6 isoform X1 [Coffea arabica]|uniref:Protein arginine N-methyltransferase 1.6 isoform X1 n=1 Tax=Coffea arabica TaxID=13443 RepID=A0A6P6TPZ4_COFAR
MLSLFLEPRLLPNRLLSLCSLFTILKNPSSFQFKSRAVRNMSSDSAQRMFQLKLDPLTGNSEWVVIEENQTPEEKTKEPLLATTSYLDMLNDSHRNRAFRQAIDKTITKPCHVLDIGAGTGLLSMMAARAMGLDDSSTSYCPKGKVTACESYLPMVKLMRKVLRANGMDKKVRVINKRSDELEVGIDMSSRADVLVSEILDSELLGEGLIPTLQHAHDNLLVENPQTVPYRATTYGQLVESPYLRKLHDLINNEAKALDGIYLVPNGVHSILQIKEQQFAMHCDAMKEEFKLLSEPFKVFDFEFWKRPESNRKTEVCIKATNDGTIHAIVSWWLLQLDNEGTIFYCTGPKWISDQSKSFFPGMGNWCDHWKQCIWFLPEKGMTVCKHQEVFVGARHTKTSISYRVKTSLEKEDGGHCDPSPGDNQIFLTPEQIAIYGDCNWRLSMFNVIKNALKQKVSPMCIVVDDSLFLPIAIASLSKSAHVIALFPGLREKGTHYLQAVASSNLYSMDRLEVLRTRNQQLTMEDTHQTKVGLFVGEPFYYGNENVLPWRNLRFWKERTMLDSVLSKDVLIVPCKGILRACAMSLPDFWRSHRCLQEIEGFDHSVANSTLGACGDLPADEEGPCLPFPIWQCGESKRLSDTVSIMEFDFLKPISSCAGTAQVEFTESGICHGFVLWIDWMMDSSTELSTGPDKRYWKQAVKLLNKPVAAGSQGLTLADCSSIEIKASFDPSSGDLNIKYVFF